MQLPREEEEEWESYNKSSYLEANSWITVVVIVGYFRISHNDYLKKKRN